MIDGSEKCKRQLAFEPQNTHVFEKRSKQKILAAPFPKMVGMFFSFYISIITSPLCPNSNVTVWLKRTVTLKRGIENQ